MTRNLISLALATSFILSAPVLAGSPAQTGFFAQADGAGTSATNPAGMTRLKGTHHELHAIVALGLSSVEVNQDQSTYDGGDPDSDYLPVVVPGYYYVTELNEDWRFGFSANIPSGVGADNGNKWAGRYYSDEFSLIYIAATPAIAYKVNDNLSLGAAISFTYNYSSSTSAVKNTGPDSADGKLEYEAGALAINTSVSMLYEFNQYTRIGLVYGTEGSADLEGDLEFSGLDANREEQLANLQDGEFEVENIIPQRVQFGLYHETEQGDFFTFDTVWADFSEFGSGDVSINESDTISVTSNYKDVWFMSLGYGWQAEDNLTYKVGVMHVTSGIDDEYRSLSMPIDELWGVGAGFTLDEGENKWDVNFNIYKQGDAKVDTGPSLSRGRVVTKRDTPYALALDIAYHW
ncbi:OmpP1/FadL family transporter [Thalassomonas sp. M1454]|uniref:OmpP1/FadL family transporter n=1 Tax=Thalassomonas sp. M1454 TaxID=2594477 RepID=UPI00117E6541|nr:outer membrane protein transport protein [Thalassomonas sp. M1454]TRX58113.1 hypothetical protein FNN08_01620 [Thalassomonas sp. M1454]